MTKQQISALTKRMNAKIQRHGLTARPLSDEQKRRFEQIRRRSLAQEEQEEQPQHIALRA
jgi:hypothetical protein